MVHNLWCTVCDAVKWITAEVFQTVSPGSPTSWRHQQIHSVRTEFIASTIESVTNIVTNTICRGAIVQCISAWIGQGWVTNYIAVERTTHHKTTKKYLSLGQSDEVSFRGAVALVRKDLLHLLVCNSMIDCTCSPGGIHCCFDAAILTTTFGS